ncbi:alpha/beta hydrolase [Telluribacter sp.]|jgi:pimeloyl-ACP methyl ester carboxylesterase|uniref:alpha/beta hydrolase n=1 Tax=Telluribacter sp. TaxID=1978767 RepID=UPI002E0D634A|nr:alpha/beta hydrolase [Telluribacter sp.]
MLHYHRLGHGPHVLLAFHGIGQDGINCYQPFAEVLGDYYTLYAFDLYFHGQSRTTSTDDFHETSPITKAAWKQIVQEFLSDNSIDRFDVAGFSMGGRFALATLEAFPEQIGQAYLMAPDGVREHPLYGLATRLAPGRYLFRQVLEHPDKLFSAARLLEKAGLLHSSLIRFVQHMLATPAQRQTVYHSWLGFRPLRFNISVLYGTLHNNGVLVYLFMGKYDQLLRPDKVRVLSRRLPENQYIVLSCGHTQLVAKAAAYLSSLVK